MATPKDKAAGVETRRYLRATFPGIKFSVRCPRGSQCFGYLEVSWTDGPTADQVEQALEAFECASTHRLDRRWSPEAEAHFTHAHGGEVGRPSRGGEIGWRDFWSRDLTGGLPEPGTASNGSDKAGYHLRPVTVRGDRLILCEWCGWISGRQIEGKECASCKECGLDTRDDDPSQAAG